MDYIFDTFMISCVQYNLSTFPVFLCYQARAVEAVTGCMNISGKGMDRVACLRRMRSEVEPETRFRQKRADPLSGKHVN